MLQNNNILALLAFLSKADNLALFQSFLTGFSQKHTGLNKALAESDDDTRCAALANVLYQKSKFLGSSDDKVLEKIFLAFNEYVHKVQGKPLSPPSDVTQFCTNLLALKSLTQESRKKISEQLLIAENIFDSDGAILPLLQIVSGNDYFNQLAHSDQKMSELMKVFFGGSFNEHTTFDQAQENAAAAQAVLDIPRESFHFKTRFGTLIAGANKTEEYVLSIINFSEIERANYLNEEPVPTMIQTWNKEAKQNSEQFCDELVGLLETLVPMDKALVDFWRVRLLNQNGPQAFPSLLFFILQHAMSGINFDAAPYNLNACLHAVQNALRMKKLLLTYVNEHELQLSWVGEQDHFSFTIKNRYFGQDAVSDLESQTGTFRDIDFTLEKFCLPIDESAFRNAQSIETTEAYKDSPKLGLTYQVCCDLFWEAFAQYVLEEKVLPVNRITKENDLPALLMHCAKDAWLSNKSPDARKNVLQAIGFHWLQLLNSGRQEVLKAQIKLPFAQLIEKIPDEIKAIFKIQPKRFFSSLWSLPRSNESPEDGSDSLLSASVTSSGYGSNESFSSVFSSPTPSDEVAEADTKNTIAPDTFNRSLKQG